MVKIFRFIKGLFLLVFTVVPIYSQADSNLALPEYFGIYAIVDGKLCGITVPTEGCKVSTVSVKTDAGTIQAIEYKKGLRFLVYQENPSSFVQGLELRPMIFIRNVKQLSTFGGKIAPDENPNVWRYLAPEVQMKITNSGTLAERVKPITFLIKPFKPNAVIVVPYKELEAGLFMFTGKDFASSGSVYFWSGDASVAQSAKCLDIVSYPPISENFHPCEGIVNTEQVSTSIKPQSNLSSKELLFLDELIKINVQFNEARSAGDKVVLEDLLAEKFGYYDQRFDKFTDRAKFIEKVKKGSVSSFKCSNYRLDKEPAGMPILRGTCDFKSRVLFGMVDLRGTFSMTVIRNNGAWKVFTFQVDARPIQ